jgi:hypothetical protein
MSTSNGPIIDPKKYRQLQRELQGPTGTVEAVAEAVKDRFEDVVHGVENSAFDFLSPQADPTWVAKAMAFGFILGALAVKFAQ